MGKTVCATHDRAYDIGGQCPWCEPLSELLPLPALDFSGSAPAAIPTGPSFFDVFPMGKVSYIEGVSGVGKTTFAQRAADKIQADLPFGPFSTIMPAIVYPVLVARGITTMTTQPGVRPIPSSTYSSFLNHAQGGLLHNRFCFIESNVDLDVTPQCADALKHHAGILILATHLTADQQRKASTVLHMSRNMTVWKFQVIKADDPFLMDFSLDMTKL